MPGELLLETLARRVREETGLVVQDVRRFLYGMHLDDTSRRQLVACVFEVEASTREVRPDDPYRTAAEARFFTLSEAVARLQSLPPPRSEPIIAHLRGEARPGAMWFYRGREDGTYQLVARVDGGGASPENVAPR